MADKDEQSTFDETIIIRDYDLKTNKTTYYLVPEKVWKEYERPETDPVLAPILPLVSKGTLLAAVPETNPQGASCYLVNLADLWVNHDPEYLRHSEALKEARKNQSPEHGRKRQ